jgi:formiminotetrahydrofolate cyclodeaminase
MSKTRTGAPEETTDLAEAAGRLQSLRDRLLQLVDEDSDAYGRVRAALRLPRNSEAEKTTRRHAVGAAMTAATATPLDTMRACQQALRGAVVVAANGTRNASSDVGVGVELLLAALRGARMNVDINLATLTDAAFVSRVREEIRELESDAAADADNARRALQ